MPTLYSLSEQVLLLLKGGNPSQSSATKMGEVKAVVAQLINQKIKGEYFNVVMGEGERIPDGAMLATYDNVAVVTYGEVAKATLPAAPLHLPRGMGVWQVSPKDQYISGGGTGSNANANAPIPADLTYVVGLTSGAPTAGTNTFIKSTFAGWGIRLFRGKIKQATIDDGSGSYYTKPTTSNTLTLSDTWQAGELVQIEFYAV